MHKNLDQYNATTGALANWVKAKHTIQIYEGRLTKSYGPNHILTFGGEYRPEKFRGTAVDTGEGYFWATHESGATKKGSTATLNYLAAYVQ
jgi:outer membrane receptor for ferrienterochelin and colicins